MKINYSFDFKFQVLIFLMTLNWLPLYSQNYTDTFNVAVGANTPAFYSWTVPNGIDEIRVMCWGGGGSGGGTTGQAAAGGGGSGGAYAEKRFSVIPGQMFSLSVGNGGLGSFNAGNSGSPSWFGSSTMLLAVGGGGGNAQALNFGTATGAPAILTGNVGGTINYYGGGGGTGTGGMNGSISGGGGGGAGSLSNGSNAFSNIGGNGGSGGGGNGGDGSLVNENVNGRVGLIPGGGGAGGQSSGVANHYGGDGGGGMIIIDYLISTVITGNVFLDLDTNCDISAGDYPLRNFIVKASPGPYYGITDSSGNYSIYAGIANYVISPVANNNTITYSTPCINSYNVPFTNFTDTSNGNDFLLKPDSLCPNLSVDIADRGWTATSNHKLLISYCNKGFAASLNSYIDISFNSSHWVLINSTIPGTQIRPGTYRFLIGTIMTMQYGSFYLTFTPNPNLFIGGPITECFTSKIQPDLSCYYPDSGQIRTGLLLVGSCLPNDTDKFVIKNNNILSVIQKGIYKIYENNIAVFEGLFSIPQGDSIIVFYPSNGNTIRLQINFIYNGAIYPGPQVTIEGCDSNPVFGQVGQLPINNSEDQTSYTCCFPVVWGWDPNEKFVSPTGLTANHYTSPNTELEYQINFQNTGTDTARYVMVKDTISTALDFESFETVASSHPYEIQVLNSRIIEWIFPNILLPDSNTDEPNSHGFVKYRIKQLPNNLYNTIIHNSAGIIFGINEPVITNQTENIVCELPISSFTFNLTGGDSIHLNNNSTYSTVYLWAFGDNTSDTVANPVHVYSISDLYNVCLFAANDCETSVTCQSITAVGINELTGLNAFSVHPNPTSGKFTIALGKMIPKTSVKIFNTLGEVIYQKTITDQKTEIDFSNHPSGIYFVQVNNGEGQYSQKVIIE